MRSFEKFEFKPEITERTIMQKKLTMAAMLGAFAFAEEIKTDLEFGWFNKYADRGVITVDDPVTQGAVGLEYGNWYVNLWGNLDLTEENSEKYKFSELDYTIEYRSEIGGIGEYSLGAIFYDFEKAPGTTELTASFTFYAPLSPNISAFYDVEEIDGLYLAGSVSESIALGDELALECEALIGWATGNYNAGSLGTDGGSSLQDVTLRAALPIAMGDWTISPMVSWSAICANNLRKLAGRDDFVFFGVTLGTDF
jgi:hypothetical protein